jgi:hypothetical protein
MNDILRRSKNITPFLLIKSTGQKLSILKAALRYEDAPQNIASGLASCNSYINQNETNRQLKVLELKQLSAKYNTGQISAQTYNTKLDELLEQLLIHGGSFGLAY